MKTVINAKREEKMSSDSFFEGIRLVDLEDAEAWLSKWGIVDLGVYEELGILVEDA